MMNEQLWSQLIQQAVKDRRYLHQHPELSGQEYETTAFIKARLEKLNIRIMPYAEVGVVGFIAGKVGKKTIALRADIDALPIQEENHVSYASTTPNVAHMCGHDGHTAVLLAVAEWLANPAHQVDHHIMLIFQSAEEITPSGADQLVQLGVLAEVDAIFGIHLWQALPLGTIGCVGGPMMGSIDDFEVTVTGSGGHGSMPHETVDPIYITSHLMQAYQSIISRNLNPIDAGVITVGKITAGTTFNITPESATMIGTMRALRHETVTLIKERMTQLTEQICAAFGAKGTIRFIDGTPPLINTPFYAKEIERLVSPTKPFEEILPVMGGEDFSYYLKEKEGAFIFVGMGGEYSEYPHHHAKFNIDERAMEDAIQLFIMIARQCEIK